MKIVGRESGYCGSLLRIFKNKERRQHNGVGLLGWQEDLWKVGCEQEGQMSKRGGEVRRFSETKGSYEGVGSHYIFFHTHTHTHTHTYIYRVCRGESPRIWENVPYVKVHRSNPKHLYPKLNGYGDNGKRKVWSSCCSMYCNCFAYYSPYTAHVRPSVSQPSQAHSDFFVSGCHSYSEL